MERKKTNKSANKQKAGSQPHLSGKYLQSPLIVTILRPQDEIIRFQSVDEMGTFSFMKFVTEAFSKARRNRKLVKYTEEYAGEAGS